MIAWLTLRSAPDQAARIALLPWTCIACGDAGVADLLLNVLLFVPLGVVARALGYRLTTTLLVVVPITVAIELTQGLVLVGRDAALGDVLANSLGGAAGWLALPLLRHMVAPDRAFARRVITPLLVIMWLVWWGTGAGFAPALSAAGPWVGQLQHRWPGHGAFPGRVSAVEVNGEATPNDPLAKVPAERGAVNLSFDVRRDSSATARSTSTILRAVDGGHRSQVSVADRNGSLLYEAQVRASLWRLHTPSWQMLDGFMLAPGSSTAFSIAQRNGSVRIARSGSPATALPYRVTVGMGWLFVHPFVATYTGRGWIWTWLWLGWWFGLLGWIAAALPRGHAMTACAVGIGMLAAATALTGLSSATDDVVFATCAAAIAALVGVLRARRVGAHRKGR